MVTQRMVPKCRMLVYFVRTDSELVGDSVVVDIEKKFQNDVSSLLTKLLPKINGTV